MFEERLVVADGPPNELRPPPPRIRHGAVCIADGRVTGRAAVPRRTTRGSPRENGRHRVVNLIDLDSPPDPGSGPGYAVVDRWRKLAIPGDAIGHQSPPVPARRRRSRKVETVPGALMQQAIASPANDALPTLNRYSPSAVSASSSGRRGLLSGARKAVTGARRQRRCQSLPSIRSRRRRPSGPYTQAHRSAHGRKRLFECPPTVHPIQRRPAHGLYLKRVRRAAPKPGRRRDVPARRPTSVVGLRPRTDAPRCAAPRCPGAVAAVLRHAQGVGVLFATTEGFGRSHSGDSKTRSECRSALRPVMLGSIRHKAVSVPWIARSNHSPAVVNLVALVWCGWVAPGPCGVAEQGAEPATMNGPDSWAKM